MPNSTNYGSTGRPPGKFHLRHSTSRATGFFSNFLEFSQPPFDIFSIGIANNNNNICYYDNGGIKTPINLNTSTYDDNKETDTAHSIHCTDKEKWFDLIFNKSNNNNSITSNNNNSNNNDNDIGYYNGGIKTPISLSAYDDNKEADTAHSIHRTDKTKWFDLIFNKNNNNDSISNNSNNEFDTSSLSYSTNAFPTTTTPTTTTDYNTSTNDKDDEDKALNNNRRMAAKDNISNGTKRNEFDAPPTADTPTTTTTTPTIDYNTSAYDDNNKANIFARRIHRTDKSTVKQFDGSKNNNSTNRIELTFNNNINNNNNNNTIEFDTSPISISNYDDNKEADTVHSIHRTDKTKWFDLIFNKNNNNNTSNNIDCASTVTSSTTTSTTTNDETFHLPFLFKDHDKEDGISTDVAFGSRSLNQIISNNYNNEFDASPTADTPTTTTNITTTTTTTTIIDYNTSTNDKNDKEKALNNNRRTLAAKDINNNNISSNNNINNNNNNNNNSIDPSSTTSTTTSITVTKDNDKTFCLSVLFKLISLYLNSSSPKEFKTAKEKQQQQQQQHYHGKQRHQFHLEQQQKHQHFKQVYNAERMVTSILLKLTLVAWDIWMFRNVY